MGRLVVLLDEAGRVVRKVLELAVDLALLQGGVVDLAEFGLRRVEVSREAPLGVLGFDSAERELVAVLTARYRNALT